MRRIKKFKSQLNREKFWQKQPGTSTAASSAEDVRELGGAIEQNLEKIENYIRRELYHHVTVENLPSSALEPQALLDEVFLEVSSDAVNRPENVPLEQWMFQVARTALKQRIEGLQASQEQPRIDEISPKPSNWEDEQLHFYQPDEVLRLEDLMSDDHSISPEKLLEQEEAYEQLQRAVANLPGSVRESFVLFALEGFNSDEIAMITGKSPSEVLDDVERARIELRDRASGR